MNIATPTAARKPFSNFFSQNAEETLTVMRSMTPAEFGTFMRLELEAFVRDGTLPADERLLARYAGLPVATFRKVWASIRSLLNETLVEVSGTVVRFARAIGERLYREKTSKVASEKALKKHAKSLKNKDVHDAGAHADAYAGDVPLDSSSKKEDSPYSPPRGPKPKFGFPDLEEEPTGAGPQNQAGSNQEDTRQEREEVQTPPSSGRPPRSAKRGSQVDPSWRPQESTVAWARNGTIGATDAQIEEQLEAFRDHHISKGSTFKDHDRAFQTWIRNAKRFGHFAIREPRQQKSFRQQDYEREFSL